MTSGRPRAATTAAIALLAAGVAGAAQAATEFAQLGHLTAGRKVVSARMGEEMTLYLTNNLRSNTIFAAVIGLAMITAIALVRPVLRGRGWARKAAWIGGPLIIILQVMLVGADSGSVRTGQIMSDGVAGGHANAVEFTRLLVAGWYPPLHFLFEGIALAAIVAACILLTRREASEYFAREREADDDHLWSIDSVRRN